jgi:zinc protease
VTAAELAAMHKRLWGSSAAQLAVVGDFDSAAIEERVRQGIAVWKSPTPYQRLPLPFHPTAGSDDTIDTPDKEMAFVAAGQALAVRDDDPDYAALHMWNYILGGSPSSRLFLRLRQQEGISYGVFAQLAAHPIDRSAFLFAAALAAPVNMGKAMAGITGEIESMLKTGVSEKELSEAKQSYLKAWEARIAGDDFVVGELNQGLFLGRTLKYWSDLNAKIEKLTAAQVNATARRFIDPSKLAKVKAGDLAKSK